MEVTETSPYRYASLVSRTKKPRKKKSPKKGPLEKILWIITHRTKNLLQKNPREKSPRKNGPQKNNPRTPVPHSFSRTFFNGDLISGYVFMGIFFQRPFFLGTIFPGIFYLKTFLHDTIFPGTFYAGIFFPGDLFSPPFYLDWIALRLGDKSGWNLYDTLMEYFI